MRPGAERFCSKQNNSDIKVKSLCSPLGVAGLFINTCFQSTISTCSCLLASGDPGRAVRKSRSSAAFSGAGNAPTVRSRFCCEQGRGLSSPHHSVFDINLHQLCKLLQPSSGDLLRDCFLLHMLN